MLLTKDQQNFITKVLDQIATEIREEQQNDSEGRSGAVEGHLRWERIGRQAAYEKCYHIAKSAAEQSYASEYDGADQKIEEICNSLEAQARTINQLSDFLYEQMCLKDRCDPSYAKELKDQSALLKRFVRDIRLIIHLSRDMKIQTKQSRE